MEAVLWSNLPTGERVDALLVARKATGHVIVTRQGLETEEEEEEEAAAVVVVVGLDRGVASFAVN